MNWEYLGIDSKKSFVHPASSKALWKGSSHPYTHIPEHALVAKFEFKDMSPITTRERIELCTDSHDGKHLGDLIMQKVPTIKVTFHSDFLFSSFDFIRSLRSFFGLI